MDLGLAGRVALVNGASLGLGFASARAIASEGATVVITGRDPANLKIAEQELASLGGEVGSICCDLTEPNVPRELVEQMLSRYGRLDVVVVNSGGPPRVRSLDVTEEQLHGALEANLLFPIRMVQASVPVMREAGYGRVSCITSWGVIQPLPGLALSNMSRTGLWAWLKTAAQDLMGSGVTLNLACPGPHPTGGRRTFEDMEHVGDVADFGRIVAFMCSEAAGFLSGHALVVDGGRSLTL